MPHYNVPARSGIAFEVRRGARIRVIDREGHQVSDLICFSLADTREHLSAGRTTDYNEKLFLSTGEVLYSERSRAMLTIEEDQVGRHSLLYAPCSPEMFRITYGITEETPNCLDNFTKSLEPHGIEPWRIPTPFNIFLNAELSTDGAIAVRPARSRAGEFIDLRVEMDLLVAVTACSALTCNDGCPTAIDVEVEPAQGD